MKHTKLLLFLLLVVHTVAFAQEDRFMNDLAAMKISLCLKDFTVADNQPDRESFSRATTSLKVFISLDSAYLVLLTIRNIKPPGQPETIAPSDKGNIINRLFNPTKRISNESKFGARSLMIGGMEERPSTRFQGYRYEWGVMVFGNLGDFTLMLLQKENSRKKMSEKAFVNFASEFIRFNN